MSAAERAQWIEHEGEMPLTLQCELAGIPRSTVYRRLEVAARQQCLDEEDGLLRALIDEEYTNRPFYGSRRMVVFLRGRGYRVNRKRVQRLMRGWAWRAWRRGRRRANLTLGTRSILTCCAVWR
jgi:putative transposase